MSTPDWTGKKWRYQPVYTERDGERTITLCEAWFDADNRLVAWTENPAMVPQGETADELAGDLARMLVATRRWEPTPFTDLKVGMTFTSILFDANALLAELGELSQ